MVARTFRDIAMEPDSRGLLLGETGTGKSTLAEHLLRTFAEHNRDPRILIIDSKPRFRGETQLNGLPGRWLYRGWRHGAAVPNSVVLPLDNPGSELRLAWERGYRVALAQAYEPEQVPLLRGAVDAFFRGANAKYQQLLYIDETSDFYGSSGLARAGDAILRTVRAGREKGVGVLASAQRPKGIPKSLLTELTCLYCFRLSYAEDIEHLREMGLPEQEQAPEELHQFLYFHKYRRGLTGKYRLALPDKTAKGGGRVRGG